MVNLGTGDNSDLALNGVSIFNGEMAGNLTMLSGSGEERLQLGYVPTSSSAATAGNLTIGGNVTINAKELPGAMIGGLPGGNILDTGAEPGIATGGGPFVAPTVVIGGNLTTLGVNAVQLAQNTTVGGSVSQTTLRAQQLVGDAGDLYWGTIGGNLSIQGAPSSAGDVIQIGDQLHTATIGGNLSIQLGNGNNELEDSAPLNVDGNTIIEMGDGNNALGLNGTYFGNMSLQLGNGNNTDGSTAPHFFTADPFFGSSAVVAGNFTLQAGNGANNFTPTAGGFAGEVDGSTNFTLGNGANAAFNVASAKLGGPLSWRSGNGNDSLSLTPAGGVSTLYNANVLFGNGDDSFALGAGANLTGSVDGGGRLTANQFFPDGGTLVSPITISNFP